MGVGGGISCVSVYMHHVAPVTLSVANFTSNAGSVDARNSFAAIVISLLKLISNVLRLYTTCL